MSKLNEETLTVLPVNTEKIIKELTGNMKKNDPPLISDKETLILNKCAILQLPGGFILLDNECCYQLSETRLSSDKMEPEFKEWVNLSFGIKTITGDDGKGCVTASYIPSAFNYTLDCKTLLEYCSEAISLREFMGSRYKYNPRIITNMKELIQTANNVIIRTNGK